MDESEPLTKYDALLNERLVYLKELYPLNDKNNWQLDVKKSDLTIHSLYHKETGLKIVRAQTLIKAPPNKLIEIGKEITTVLEWDKTLEDCKQLYEKDGYHVLYALIKKIPLVVQREGIFLSRFYYEDDGTIYSVATSIDYPGVEESIYRVRAKAYLVGWVLKTSLEDANSTDYTFILHVDPLGWIPKPIINWFSYTQGYNIRTFGDYAEKRYKEDNLKASNREIYLP